MVLNLKRRNHGDSLATEESFEVACVKETQILGPGESALAGWSVSPCVMRPTARSIFSTARNELSLQFLLSRSPCSCVLTGHFVAAYPTISRRTWPIVADLTMYGWRPLLNELTSANGVVVNRASYSLFNTRSTGSDLGSGHDRTLQGLHHNGDKAA